jgi:hypothetical protein
MSAVLADQEPLLTTSQIAHKLGCHPSAVVRWIQKGSALSNATRHKLEAVATPGGWRVRPSALDSFLEVITADRAGETESAPAEKPARRSERLQRLDSALKAAGF